MRWRKIKKNLNTSKIEKKFKEPIVIYAPIWKRAIAFGADMFMIGMPISILLMVIFGYEALQSPSAINLMTQGSDSLEQMPDPLPSIIQIMLASTIYITFWRVSAQTPGKKMLNISVVDANTNDIAPLWKLIIRFFAYFISAITVVGFFIGAFREDKRTLHDLLSGTVVISQEP